MNKWVLLAVFAFAGHGEFVAFAAMSEPGRQLVASDFANGTNGWTITNYNDVLSVSVTNGPDGAALVLANEKPGPGLLNTCFFVCSDWFPVEAGAELAAVVEARGEVSMLGPYVSGGVATGIKWFDAAKRPLCAQDVLGRMVPVAFEFGFRSLGFGWNKTVRTCVVPKGAAFAQIQLGGTEPDIPCGKRIEIRRIAVRARVPNASWDFGDLEPPKFELVSMTPNPDRMAEIRFRISDASKLDRESFVCKIDGVDVFPNLTYVGKGVCAYRPLRPWDEDSLHLIELDASDVHGNRGRETLAHFCGKRIEKGLVTLRDDGMTLVDGKPFFPIAPFAYKAAPCNGNDLERGLRDLKAIGVNAVHTYSTYQFGEKQAYGHHREYLGIVDACEKVGMKLIVEPGDRDYANPDRAMRLREIMLKARDHSCFLVWCIGDDTANYRRGDEVKTDDNIIKAMDNARLTTQADITTYAGRYRPYVHSTDTLMTEIYPFKAEIPEPAGLANVVRCMKFAADDKRAVGDPVRGIWPLVQAFKGWKTWKRFPTREEIRAQTYLGIIHGGRGVTYYTYYSPSEGAEGVAQHMDAFGSVTKELAAIHDDLASRDAKAQPTVEILDGPWLDLNGNPSVTCLLKEGAEGKVPLLLAANAVTDKAVKAKIAGLRGCKVGTLFENGRKVDLQDGALVDVFGPGEVHVYRLVEEK